VSNLAWEAADVGGKGHGPGGAEGNGGGSDRRRPRTVARVRGTADPPLAMRRPREDARGGRPVVGGSGKKGKRITCGFESINGRGG
jgi:hypothetical protein